MFRFLRPVILLASALPVFADLPPLIDRDAFFGEVKIAAAQISPDGRYLAFLKPYKGTRNIWVKKVSDPFSAAKPLSAETKRPVPTYFWSRDSKFILFVQDQAGDENYNLYAINLTAAPDPKTGVPAARNISNAEGSRVQIYSLPKTDPDLAYIGINNRDKAWHDLYKLRLSTGERTLVRQNKERVAAWVFDNAAVLRAAVRSNDDGSTELMRVDPDKLTSLYRCSIFETCQPVHFDHANQKSYIITNKGDDVDLVQLATLDIATGKTANVESDPDGRVDLQDALFSDLDERLLATTYVDDHQRVYWKDKEYQAAAKWLAQQLPNRDFRFLSHTQDENVWIVNATSDIEPGETYVFDRKARKLTLQFRIRDELPRPALAEMKSVRYPSSDGLEISGYLTTPKGIPAKNLPLVVFPHGGPWARDEWGYSTFAQFFANRGYAVLQPNFRGSSGFGKKFLDAGNGEWGRKMQDDLTWGVKFLVAQGTVNPKRVGIAGGSYGGYATLAGVAYTPDLYSAAVAIVAPSNLVFLLNSIPPYWEAARKMMYARMADPATPQGKKLLEEESPVTAASNIKTPLMVVQGANDPRVNKRNSDEIVVAVRNHNIPVEYLVAPDEGHGFARPINNLAMIASMERFFAKHLDARYQESVPQDVAARLKEITVDPKSVTVPPVRENTATTLPRTERSLSARTLKYKATLQAGARNVDMSTITQIQDQGTTWMIVDTANTPAGAVTDTVLLNKSTLSPTERHIKQGPISIDLTFAGNKATGTTTMNGQVHPTQVEFSGPDFADGAGAMDVIAALPLAEGYQTSFSNLNVQAMQPRVMQLNVTGTETVQVPAGTFEAYKVELTPIDGAADHITVWIAKNQHEPVKYHVALASMGGTAITGERQ